MAHYTMIQKILVLLREVELHLNDGLDVMNSRRAAGVSGKLYHLCPKLFWAQTTCCPVSHRFQTKWDM